MILQDWGCLAAQDPRWAGWLLQSSISSGAKYGFPRALEHWIRCWVSLLGDQWWVLPMEMLTLGSGSCHRLQEGCWDQHSSACAAINLSGISAKSVPAELQLLCSMRRGNSVAWLALLAFPASPAVLLPTPRHWHTEVRC